MTYLLRKPLNHYNRKTINIFTVANDFFPRFRRCRFRICNKKNCRFCESSIGTHSENQTSIGENEISYYETEILISEIQFYLC